MILLATIAMIWLCWQALKLVGLLLVGLFKLLGWTVRIGFKALWFVLGLGLALWLVASFAALITPAGIVACAVVAAILSALGHGRQAA